MITAVFLPTQSDDGYNLNIEKQSWLKLNVSCNNHIKIITKGIFPVRIKAIMITNLDRKDNQIDGKIW